MNPPEHLDSPFAALLLITFLALIVPVIVRHITFIRLPGVVGEILAGIVIGRSGLNLVEATPILTFLQEFGFTLLMFLSGLEMNLGALRSPVARDTPARSWQQPIPLALLIFVLTVVMALIVGVAMAAFNLASNPILMGLILSTTSLGIVVPVLKERGLTTTRYGQVLLVSALISDFVTLLLLSLVIAILSQGLTLDLLLVLLLLAAFVAAVHIGGIVSRLTLLTRIIDELSHATAQIQVRGALALMVAWVVLAQALGVEVILGAFLAGAIISFSRRRADSPLPEKLDAIGFGFFIPLFFIMVGAEFDIRTLLASPRGLLLVPVLIAGAYIVKIVPALLLRSIFSWRETLAAGMLLASRLSLIIAASAIALELGAITPATNAALILVAIVTCTFSPIFFGRLLPIAAASRRHGTIILGTDQLAHLLGERLRRRDEEVVFLGIDAQGHQTLADAGFRTVVGDPATRDVLEAAGAAHARALIATMTPADLVPTVCRLAKDQFGIPTIVAHAREPSVDRALQQSGVQVVQPALASALALEGALLFPAAFAMLLDTTDETELVDAPIHSAHVVGKSLRRVRLPGNVLVLGIRRGGEVIVPHGDTVLQQQDILMLIGNHDGLINAREWLNGHITNSAIIESMSG